MFNTNTVSKDRRHVLLQHKIWRAVDVIGKKTKLPCPSLKQHERKRVCQQNQQLNIYMDVLENIFCPYGNGILEKQNLNFVVNKWQGEKREKEKDPNKAGDNKKIWEKKRATWLDFHFCLSYNCPFIHRSLFKWLPVTLGMISLSLFLQLCSIQLLWIQELRVSGWNAARSTRGAAGCGVGGGR